MAKRKRPIEEPKPEQIWISTLGAPNSDLMKDLENFMVIRGYHRDADDDWEEEPKKEGDVASIWQVCYSYIV